MMPTQESQFEIISIEEAEKHTDEDGTVTYAGIMDATGLLPLLHKVYMDQLLAHATEEFEEDISDEKAGIVLNANIVLSKTGKIAVDIERIMVNHGFSFGMPFEYLLADALGLAVTVTPVPLIAHDNNDEDDQDDLIF